MQSPSLPIYSANYPLSDLPSSTGFTSGATATTILATATGSAIAPPPSSQHQGSSPLTTAARVGIAVGVALAGLALIIVFGIYLGRRRNRQEIVRGKRSAMQETPRFVSRRIDVQSLKKAKARSYRRTPIELPSDSPPLRGSSRYTNSIGIRPKSPSDEDNWI